MKTKEIIEDILIREGWPKFTNLPNDRGGPTKGGITLGTLSEYMGRKCSEEELMNLKKDTAIDIYMALFVQRTHYDCINDDHLQGLMVDCAVLHGVLRANKWLQEALMVKPDGVVGPITLGSLVAADKEQIYTLVCCSRIEFIGEIISANYKARKNKLTDKDQAEFAHGWLRRAVSFLREQCS